jgi:formylglycine-generating enzyme required for sulfatase activity
MKARLTAVLVCVGCVALAPGGDKPIDKAEQVLRRFVDEFVVLKPGAEAHPASFRMGSAGDAPAQEQPAHTVTLKQPFAIARYEVTQELYEAIMGRNPSKWGGPRNSVEMVNWDEAVQFCRKATAELRRLKLLAEGEEIRLPSEAEWEYACRAGTTTRYSFGDDAAALGAYCWFTGNAKGNDPPVGAKKPNPWGLYDVHGYIWEWCQDAWHPTYEGAPADGSAWEAAGAKERVLRGGAWTETAENCRSATRGRRAADYRSDAVGFRCVRTIKKGASDER